MLVFNAVSPTEDKQMPFTPRNPKRDSYNITNIGRPIFWQLSNFVENELKSHGIDMYDLAIGSTSVIVNHDSGSISHHDVTLAEVVSHLTGNSDHYKIFTVSRDGLTFNVLHTGKQAKEHLFKVFGIYKRVYDAYLYYLHQALVAYNAIYDETKSDAEREAAQTKHDEMTGRGGPQESHFNKYMNEYMALLDSDTFNAFPPDADLATLKQYLIERIEAIGTT